MDLYDDSRTLIYSGFLARRQRSETDWHGWNDYFVALLDNFCKKAAIHESRMHYSLVPAVILTREETRSNGVVKRHVGSRVSCLHHLQLHQIHGYNVLAVTVRVSSNWWVQWIARDPQSWCG